MKEEFALFYYFDPLYLYLVLPALLLALFAQFKVQSTFNRYSQVYSGSRMTGAQAARAILDRNGLYDVRIEHVSGKLSDHYDPRTNVVRLSDSVYNNTSIAAIGVAAHETGHALQYAEGYSPIKLRAALIPITNIGSQLAIPLVLFGFLLDLLGLVYVGIILYSTMALFQLVTLPVEFNASSRALKILDTEGILYNDELDGAKKVLSAAALTYVAALIVSLAQLLRLIALFGRRRND